MKMDMKTKRSRRFILFILFIALFTLNPAKIFAQQSSSSDLVSATGSIRVLLKLSFPETRTVLGKGIRLSVNGNAASVLRVNALYDSSQVLTVLSAGAVTSQSCPTVLTALNEFGLPITTENYISYFLMEIKNLKPGEYSLSLEGEGYTKYTSPPISLGTHSKQLNLSTENGGFGMGDVNGDNAINQADVKLLSDNLGLPSRLYDLNRDGIVDITDIAYANHNRSLNQSATGLYDTELIAGLSVDLSQMEAGVKGSLPEGQRLDALFTAGSLTQINALDSQTPIEIPISFKNPVLMEKIDIRSPLAAGAVEGGRALVVYEENGLEQTIELSFGGAKPQGVVYLEQPLPQNQGNTAVTIDLGKKVAVKKVTIIVEKVAGSDGKPSFTVIEEIKFLNIVPNTQSDTTSPQNFSGIQGNEQVSLSWSAMPNVTGYKVKYGTQPGAYTNELMTQTNSLSVKGLKNLSAYYFVVYGVNGSWTGSSSKEIRLVPQPLSIPNPPDNLSLSAEAGAISLRFGKTENALSYKVYYKKVNESAFVQQAEIAETQYRISPLETEVEYEVYVTAVNSMGESRPSLTSRIKTLSGQITIPKIPTLRRIPSTEILEVSMTNKNNVANEYLPNFNVRNVCDDNFNTSWAARAWWESSEFTFTFASPKEMDYMVYVPRLDGDYKKSLEFYTIYVWNSLGEKKLVADKLRVQNNPDVTGYAVLPFERTADIKKISVSLAQWAGSPTNVSLAEVAFYQYYEINDRIKALFTDETFTALRPGITQTSINALIEELSNAEGYFVEKDILLDEVKLASALLTGNTAALGLLPTVKSVNISGDIKKINDFQPLGLVGLANSTLVVYASIPAGEKLELIPTQYFAEAGAWMGAPISLSNGRNVVRIPTIGTVNAERGGSLYLRYAGSRASEIRLQIRGGIKIPVLELSAWNSLGEGERRSLIGNYITELSAYVKTVTGNKATAVRNSTEISLPKVLLSLPADQVLAGITAGNLTANAQVDRLYNNTLAWADLIGVLYKTHGIDDPNTEASRQNIRYARMFGNAFMYASGQHIGIGYGSAAALVQGVPVGPQTTAQNQLFGWGIAHEIGHVMDTLGKAEITNNIYSLFGQTYDGNQNALPSRLETQNVYEEIFSKTASGYPGMSNNVFVSLGMYWQLHLAYDQAQDSFYNKLNKAYRSGEAQGFTGDERFALVASKIAGRDLSEFFTRWGIRLSEAALAQMRAYPAEARKLHYLSDESRRQRLKGTIPPPNATVSLNLQTAENKISLNYSLSSTPELLQGFEILRDSETIAFTKDTLFVDELSSNNRLLNYQVKAIDIFGNVIGSSPVVSTKLSHEGIIDKSKWSIVQQDEGFLVTMANKESIAGIKTPVPVEVMISEDGVNFKSVHLSSFEPLYYFSKPNTTDSRIWTYDAKLVKIKGLNPQDVAGLDFISYPGDNIELGQPAIGRLGAEYRYGTGADERIEAGSLVLYGTYRGDPVFNTIMIKGKFAEGQYDKDSVQFTERAINGYSLLFAEIPPDGQVSTLADGIWIFVPEVQAEQALLAENGCLTSILPTEIQAELYRTDNPSDPSSKRLVSNTRWVSAPTEESLPTINLR